MKQGVNDISLNIGNSEIDDAYLGSVQVYSSIPLPYDARVEYLASNSQAYIDTGISGGNDNLEITCEFKYTTHIQYAAIYGNYVADANNGVRFILNTSGSTYVNNNTKCVGGAAPACSINNWHTIVSTQSTTKMDGVSVTTPTTMGTTNNGNIAIFNRSLTNPNTSRDIGAQIKSFKIKDNGVLVLDMIPVRVGSVGYMYDKVSGQLFGNVGTGAFTYGNDV